MPQELTDITQDIDEILEIDVADIDSILGQPDTTSIPGIDDKTISDVKTKDILERIESRKEPNFIDSFFRNIGNIINIQKPPIAQIGLKSNIDRALSEGDIEEVKRLANLEGSLNQIKDVYSLDQNRGFWANIGTSFLQNILPDWIDNSGDERTIRLQEEINAVLQSEGMEPVAFDNQLTFTQNLGKAIGNTAAVLPYYFLGGVVTAPSRALALSKIVQIANPRNRAILNVIQNVGHTAAAFTAAEAIHSGFDPKNLMVNGVLQGSGEAVAEMAIYSVLSKVMGPSAKYPARYLATSTSEFFQELTGQYFATGKIPDLETIGITAAVSGLFGLAARRGMEVDILHVYDNAVKDRERLLKKRKNNPDSFNEEDLLALNQANNLAETIKNNAANWRLKDAFTNFKEDRKRKRGESFQKARNDLERVSGLAGALATEVDVEGLTESPQKLVGYLRDRGFSDEEIAETTPEDILADPRIITEAEFDNLVDNYYDIYQGIENLQEELGDPGFNLTEQELFGDLPTERELGITKEAPPLPTKEELGIEEESAPPEIPEITEAELLSETTSEEASLEDQIENEFIERREVGASIKSPLMQALQIVVKAGWDFAGAIEAIKYAVKNGRIDIAQAILERARRRPGNISTEPGLPKNHPKYSEAKSKLEASKAEAESEAKQLENLYRLQTEDELPTSEVEEKAGFERYINKAREDFAKYRSSTRVREQVKEAILKNTGEEEARAYDEEYQRLLDEAVAKRRQEREKSKPVKKEPVVEEPTKKLGEELISERGQATRKAVEKGLTMTGKEAQEYRSEIEKGYKQFFEDIESGVDPQSLATEQLRLQTLREALSAKVGKFVEYDETGFKESPIEGSYLEKAINDIKAGKVESTTRPKKTIQEKIEEVEAEKKPIKSLPVKETPVHAGKGQNIILSNFAQTPFNFRGKMFKTAEGAYQAWKSGKYSPGFENLSGSQAKSAGRGKPVDRSKNLDLMREILREKYNQVPEFRDALNNAGRITHPVSDKFWSENFPKILEELKGTEPKIEKPKPRKDEFPLKGERGGFATSTGEVFVDETTPGLISVSDLKKYTNDKGFLDQYTIKTAEGIAEHEKAHAITEAIFQARNLHPSVKNKYGIPSDNISQQRYIKFLDDFDSAFEKIRDENERLRKENKRNQTIPLITDFLKGEKYQLTDPASEELTNQIALWKKFPDLHKKVFPEFNKILSNNSDIISEVAKAIGQVSVVRKRRAKLPSGEIVDIIEQPTFEQLGLDQPTLSDIDETLTTSDLPTQTISPVDIPQSDLTEKDITSNDIPIPDTRDVQTDVDNTAADYRKETDGRDEQNVEENTQLPQKNGLIVTRITNHEDVRDSYTLSGWFAARNIALLPGDIDLAAINSNQSFPDFVKTISGLVGKDKLKSLKPTESMFRRVWFKSKDKITKRNFIYEPGKGITLNTSRAPDNNFIDRIDNASPLDVLVREHNNQNPDDLVNIYYFSGYYVENKSKRTGRNYYSTLSNAQKSVREKQKEFMKSRFIFYSTASDGKKEVWIQASPAIWQRFSDEAEATKFYNDRKNKYDLPDLKKTDNTQFLATRLYYFEKMDGILKTGLTDANFTKRAQIYMAAGGNLSGLSFKTEFRKENSFYSFDPNTHEITRSEKGEKEAHDGAIYVTLDKMKEIMSHIGEGSKRIFKPFLYTVDKNGRPIGLKCACFVAPVSMESEMKKKGVDTVIYLSSEKMGQVKGGERLTLDGKDMVVHSTEVEEHSEVTFTRAIFPTLPVSHGNLRPTNVFNRFVKKRIDQFTKLVGDLLGNADEANRFLRKHVKYTGNSKYENVGRMLEMGFSWHPEVINVTKDIFKNKYINDNLMKFKRKGSTSYLSPDHNGTVKVGEVLLPEHYKTNLGVKIGDKVVVNRSPSARVDNFRVLTVKGFSSRSRHGNAITMNGGETIFYQESDYDIDKVHVIVDMTPEEIEVLESLQKAVGVVPVEKSEKVDNVWDVNQQWDIQDRFAIGKTAIGEITNIQTVYSMLVQNGKALQVDRNGDVVVVDLNYAMKNSGKDKFYLIPKYQDAIEMQKFIAPIHQASVDNAKLDALSTIMNGQPYSRGLLISSLFDVTNVNWETGRTLPDDFDPLDIGFNSSKSPIKQMLNVMKTFAKDWDDGGSKWSYDDQHNAIMVYKHASQNRTGETGETLFPNSPLHVFFTNYPRASLTNGGYFNTRQKKAVFQFRDVLRMHHWEAIESAFRKDINRLDPYKGGKISPERNEQMTNAIIEIFNLKDQHYRGEIPTTNRVEVTPNGTLNHLEGYHEKVKKLISDLNLNADEQLWFDLKMLNNFDGIQSKGKFKGGLSKEQLKETLLRDYDTRREFLTRQEGKEYKQMNPSVFFYPKSKEDAFGSRYEPYFISIAISDDALRKYANTYNNFYNQNVKRKQGISSGFLAESKGTLGVGVDPSRIMDTFGGVLKSVNKYLSPKGEASWWGWFNEDKHAEITNKQVAKINELLDRVYGTEIWGEKTVTDFIVHTLTEGTGTRPATRARLDFDKVPITIEEGNILIHELNSIYRQLNTSNPSKVAQSVFLTKQLMYKHPITRKFYDKLESQFKNVNEYAANLKLDIDAIEKGSFNIVEPINIPGLAIKSPISTKVTRKRLNAYHKLYKKYMELRIKQDIGEPVTESEINNAQQAYENYLKRNPDVKETLDLMRGVATIHQEISEAAIIGSTILKNSPELKGKLVKEGIIKDNFKSEKAYWDKVLDYFDANGIKYSTNIRDKVYDVAKRAEVRRRKKDYEDRWNTKVDMPEEQLFIAIDRMDEAAKAIYDFDKETFDKYIAPRKEELRLQIISNLSGLTTESGKEVTEEQAEEIADRLLSFIPDEFRRIDRYFPWINFDFQVERQYSVWNLDSLTDDIKSEALNLDEWLNKPATTGFFKPRRADWQTALKEGEANIPWDIPEVLRVRMLASMNVRKISAIRSEFSELFKDIRTNILEGKLTPREETFFTGIERYLNILKYDLQGIPWARSAIKKGTFEGDYSSNDYLDSTEIKEWQRTFFTNADLASKIYRNIRTFSFLGLEMPVSIRNVVSQGVVIAGSDLGQRRIMNSVTSLLKPGGVKSGGAIVPEKVNGELVTNARIMKDLALDHDDIIAQIDESQLPTQFSIVKDLDKSIFKSGVEKAYKMSGHMANWSLETINVGPVFAKSFFGIPLSFRDSEIYLNRLGTAKAAIQKVWEDFDKRGVSATPEEKYRIALEYARKKVDEIHFDYGLLNRPQMMRHKMGASLFIFRSFTWNQVNMFYNWAREWKEVKNWENTRRLLYFGLMQSLGVMLKAAIGIELVRFFDWALGDLFKDMYNYVKWLFDDDEKALNEIGFGSTKKIRQALPDIDENIAAGIAATNHIFTGGVPDMINIWLYSVSDEEFNAPWDLNRRNRNLLSLYQAGGFKQPIKISKFYQNWEKTWRAMTKGIDPKYPDETMKPESFAWWYFTRQFLGTYVPPVEYNRRLKPPAGVGFPDLDFKPKLR